LNRHYSHFAPIVRATDTGKLFGCVDCGWSGEAVFVQTCPACGGLVDVFYDLPRVRLGEQQAPPLRYFDLLPVARRDNVILLGEGNTPCVHARRLGAKVGLANLYLKYEGANPTYSTKDRVAAVALSLFKEHGISEFVLSSTGNMAAAYANAVARLPDFRLHVVCGRSFVDRLYYHGSPRITTYAVEHSLVGAGKLAREFAASRGLLHDSGFMNPGRREGAKLAWLEAFEQCPAAPDWAFQAVSSAMGIFAAYKGAVEYLSLGRLAHLPRLVCAQQQSCAPIVRAYLDGAPRLEPGYHVAEPAGMVQEILRGAPSDSYPYIKRVLDETSGTAVAVGDDEILAAARLAKTTEGLEICLASATALAAALKLARAGTISARELVLVLITGAPKPEVRNPPVILLPAAAPAPRTSPHSDARPRPRRQPRS
jgi:threonine synthase